MTTKSGYARPGHARPPETPIYRPELTLLERRRLICYRLRLARLCAGLQQGDVGRLLGLQSYQVSYLERGLRHLKIEEFAALAEYYALDVRWLLGLTNAGGPTPAAVMLAAAEHCGEPA